MIEITRRGKYSLSLKTPVMPSAGMMGFGDNYHKLINLQKLGAFVTNPVTLEPWSPASGPRVVPLDAGVLVHTGLPNPGLSKVLRHYRETWANMGLPIIIHLVTATPEQARKACQRAGAEDVISAIELGIGDDTPLDEAERLVSAAVAATEKPILARLPLNSALELGEAVASAGAAALVVCAPPRGTARDPLSGRLVVGRVYGPLLKPVILWTVGRLRQMIDPDVPIIGAGGIHSEADARDFIEVGASAVQLDTAIWIQPRLIERIARDLGGLLVTRPAGAFPDEWHPDMGDTEFRALFGDDEENRGESVR